MPRLDLGGYKPLEAPPVKDGAGQRPVTSGSGFMAAFSRKQLPRTLQVIGATMQQLGDPNDQIAEFSANEADQRRLAAAEMAQARDGKLEDQQQGYIDQAIGSLPRDQQLWARLAPGEAARAALSGGPDTYGDLETIDGRMGQRNRRTGQYDWAPQVPLGDRYAPPAGYRGTPETGLEAIPGGPADLRQTTEGRARAQQMDSSSRQLQNAIDVLTQAESNVSGGSSGLWGQMTRDVGGTPAYNLNQQLEPVRAILSFENLAEMRRNSATGGALGSIAVRELDLLGSTVRSLDTAQSPAQLRQALQDVRRQLSATLQAVQAARHEMEIGPQGAPQEPNMPSQQNGGERIMDWSPERGVY